MAEKLVALRPELPRPSRSANTISAQVTERKGSPPSNRSSATSLSTKDLFDPGLFLVEESVTDSISSWKLNSPPRIGFLPFRRGYWADQLSENPLDWSLIFDFPKGSKSPTQKCAEVKPVPSLPTERPQTDKIDTVGAGLSNLGNTCFMNAVLQCFLHSVPLVRGIVSDVRRNCDTTGFCALCSFRELISLSFTTKTKLVAPWNFIDNLGEFSKNFTRNREEDAHEFLQCFLNKLENCYSENGGHSQNENLVKELFRGGLISKLKCLKCGHHSDTYESSLGMSLEIENASSLITAIQSFTTVEKIEDPDNYVYCQRCKKKEPAEKQLTLNKVPSVATFHLKRLKNNGTFVEKIDKHVAFPLELDLLPFTVSGETTDAELKYMLHAVIVHNGRFFSSGHYYCFIRLAPSTWYRFNDTNVLPVPEDEVLSKQAYILFYAKKGSSWFSSFIGTLSHKQVSLPITETSLLPGLLRNIEASLGIAVGNLDDLQDMPILACTSDCLDEADSKPVCTTQLDTPSCKRPLEKLIDDPDTEMLKQELIGSFLASAGTDEGSRKKSRNIDT